jgi:hypothetical protein
MVPDGHGFSLNFGHMGQSGVAQRPRCFVAALSFGVLLTFDGRLAVIVDGDALAIGNERVRESFRSRCERELVRGLRAKERLAALARSWAQAQTGEKPSPSGAVRLILTKFLRSKGHSRRDQVHGLMIME